MVRKRKTSEPCAWSVNGKCTNVIICLGGFWWREMPDGSEMRIIAGCSPACPMWKVPTAPVSNVF